MTTTIVTEPPTTTPGPTPGLAYWVLSIVVMPVIGVAAVFALADPVGVELADVPGFEILVAAVVMVTTALVALLPRLRAMAPRRRAAYVAASAVIQGVLVAIYGSLTLFTVLVVACDVCD